MNGVCVCTYTAVQVRRYGLGDALHKSMTRKGSFTAPLDPRRLWAGLLHFVAVYGAAVARSNEALSKAERDEIDRDW